MRSVPGVSQGLFVTGTDTGVGKTIVACALAAWLRGQGMDVGVMKPVATGGIRRRINGRSRWVSDDAQQLVAAADADDPWALTNPICFREPLAPWTAALRAGAPIRVAQLTRAFAQLRARHGVVIVEGIGGLLVPLTPRLAVAELARRFALPLLIVARPGLGTINHTLLTVDAARRYGVRIAGIIFNTAQPPPRDQMARLAIRTNSMIIRRLRDVPVWGSLPFDQRLSGGDCRPRQLAGWLQRHVGAGFLHQLTLGNGCGRVGR